MATEAVYDPSYNSNQMNPATKTHRGTRMLKSTAYAVVWLLLTTTLVSAETVTVRSGNGTVGGTDTSVHFLSGPATGGFGHVFTSTDFADAQIGTAAYILAPNALWTSALGAAPAAKWIGTNATASCCQGNTALYAISFPILNGFLGATLVLHYAADDGIGEAGGGGPNSGVYLNGKPICNGISFVIGFSQEHDVSCTDAGSALRVGTNWLYIENGNAAGSAGLLFSATISTSIAPTISGGSLQDGVVGTSYTTPLTAGSGTPPYSNWTVSSGSLPQGLVLNRSTGVVSGVPSSVGTFNFSITVQDSAGATSTAQSFSITISPAGCSYAISPGGQAFPASGGMGTITVISAVNCYWNVSGLPAWVTLASASSGTGNGTVTFQVSPTAGGDVSGSFTIAGQTFAAEQAGASIPGLTPIGSLAQEASGGTWNLELDVINLGGSAATARVSFAGNAGSALPMPLTFPQTAPAAGPELASTLDRTLPPNALLQIDSTGPATGPPMVGWSQLFANGNVSGFGIFSDPLYNWDAVVPLETRNASTYILAFDNTGSLVTGLAIANVAAQAAGVQVIIRDDSGLQIGTATINLPPQGHTSFMLNDPQLGYPMTNGIRGTVEFDTPSGGQISVLALRANGPALTTLPVLSNVDSPGGSIAHVTYNGGFTSTFYLANTGTFSAPFTLNFSDESGNPLTVPLSLPQSGATVSTSTLTQTLAPGALLEIDTQALDAMPLVQGSAQLTSSGNIGGFEIYRWTTFGQETAVPLETRTPGSFVLVFDNTGSLSTGVALANVNASTANITANIYDDLGNLLQTTNVALPGLGHTSFMLPTNYPVTAGKRGSAQFVTPTGGRVSVIGVRATATGTLTTIPVLPQPFLASSNPQPVITSLSPSSTTAGTTSLVLTINGSGFMASSTVTFNGVSHAVAFVNGGQLRITLSATDLGTAGTFPVVVTTPSPGGGVSNAVFLTVQPIVLNPQPAITNLSPSSTAAGTTSLALTINGNGFMASSSVTFSGASHAAVLVSSGQLRITLNAADLSAVGTFPVVVTNPSPGGGVSTAATFTVLAPPPSGLTGGWSGAWGSIPVPSAYGLLTATLTQNGTSLTGSVTLGSSFCVGGGTLSGTVSGSTISATVAGGTLRIAATVDSTGNNINGAYAVYSGICAGDYGLITLKRQ